ncbi:MAG TPA: thiol peroxidase [Candidatus Marinimicrobia bacterium]|nr:thiol peroxidase [Candidatus Neomarinimicrobiota bacterium]
MAEITLKGNSIHTSGNLPEIGSKAPDFKLTGTDLKDRSLRDYSGITLILNIFPSLDTDVCAMSVRRFNQMAADMDNTKVLCISRDLPFAHKRFCVAEGIENVVSLSELRDLSFGDSYGVRIVDGPMAGLLARSVIVLNPDGTVKYTELVPEITREPDYESVLNRVK